MDGALIKRQAQRAFEVDQQSRGPSVGENTNLTTHCSSARAFVLAGRARVATENGDASRMAARHKRHWSTARSTCTSVAVTTLLLVWSIRDIDFVSKPATTCSTDALPGCQQSTSKHIWDALSPSRPSYTLPPLMLKTHEVQKPAPIFAAENGNKLSERVYGVSLIGKTQTSGSENQRRFFDW